MPSLTGMTLPINTSIASVPASIRSSLVTTAKVLLPKYTDKMVSPFMIYDFFQNNTKLPINLIKQSKDETRGSYMVMKTLKSNKMLIKEGTTNEAIYHQDQPHGPL